MQIANILKPKNLHNLFLKAQKNYAFLQNFMCQHSRDFFLKGYKTFHCVSHTS
jgi:hypothetical protein